MNAAEVTVLQQPPTPLEFAKSMAQSEQSSILLVSGPIPMDSGYPARDHANIIQIATIIAHGRRKIGLYRILQRQELHRVIEDMEHHGGYQCALYLPDGSLDSGYFL